MNAAFKCPGCHRVSHNPNDVAQRYCGACKRWWDEQAERIAELENDLEARTAEWTRQRDLHILRVKELEAALRQSREEAIKAIETDSFSMRGSSLAFIIGTCRRALRDAP